jgi:hypothetical protein
MVTRSHSDHVAHAIELWLLDKYALTQSKCTEETYRETLHSLRTYLQERGCDLDSVVVDIAPDIQAWAIYQ